MKKLFDLLDKLDLEASIRRGPNDSLQAKEKINAVITSTETGEVKRIDNISN